MVLSEISIRRPVFAWMLMIGLIGFGVISFLRLGVSQLPDVDFPIVTVNLRLEGAAPEIMERDVVDVIEDKVMSIEGVRNVFSNSRSGTAQVTVEFELARNIDLALQDVQAKVSQAMRGLPPEIDPPAITKTNPDDSPILWLTLQAPTWEQRKLMAYVRDVLKNQFATISGVGDISLGGFTDPAMRIWVKPDELNKRGLAANDISETLRLEQVDPPAGQLQLGARHFNIRFFGEVSSEKEFANLRITRIAGRSVDWIPPRIGDVARIEEGIADITTLSRAMGKPAVSLGIVKQRGANAVAVARAVRARVDELKSALPAGVELAVNFDATRYIEEAVGELNHTLLYSALLTGLVCWLFLGSLSSTFNVLLAIPVSIIGSFTAFYFLGFTLNTFTLLALTLAIGIVVDDAIMVVENIMRHREMGKSRVQAALYGAREITFAATAASISVIAIFLPVAFMTGLIGRFLYQFGVAMTIAVLISLLEALTLTPMRAALFRDKAAGERKGINLIVDRYFDRLSHGYRGSLTLALRFKWLVILGTFLLAGLSGLSYLKLRQEFLPPQDQSRFGLRVQAPVGSSLKFTDEKMREVEAFLASRPEINRYSANVGSSGMGGELNTGFVFVTMKDKGHRGIDPESGRELTQQEFMQVIRQTFAKAKNYKVMVQDFAMRGLTTSRGFPVEFTVQGPDWEKIGEYARRIGDELQNTGMVSDLDTNYRTGMPEIQIQPNRDRVSANALSLSVVGETAGAMLGGVKIGQYAQEGRRYDVRMKMEDDGRSTEEKVKSLMVRNQAGNLVPIVSVVDVSEKKAVQAISRLNRQRAVSVFANVRQGISQKAALERAQEIARRSLPEGYSVKISGSAQTFNESFQSLIMALILGLFVAYMVLASQFNSFLHPTTILIALPFSLVGAFIALWVFDQSLNIYSMIGLILLMGIAKKNSILLVDFTNHTRDAKRGISIREALLEACPIRLRPILMTSVATMASAIPAALAIGPGSETRIPMAVTVIGGVAVSTLFSLYLVPCVYLIFSRLEGRRMRFP